MAIADGDFHLVLITLRDHQFAHVAASHAEQNESHARVCPLDLAFASTSAG
jgi:hypothetical protein